MIKATSPVVTCTACDRRLMPEYVGDPATTYQFDNALWIAFHGGYGMFVDNLDATLPNNADGSQWLQDEAGEYSLVDGQIVKNPAWEPSFNQPRTLPGHPDYEAVICHDCAHGLCQQVPWLAKLFSPHNTHSHKVTRGWTGHQGWDLPHKSINS